MEKLTLIFEVKFIREYHLPSNQYIAADKDYYI